MFFDLTSISVCSSPQKAQLSLVECALHTDEVEAFSCSKCPSETSPGDGLDEIHIGDGISEGLQMDNVPDYVKNFEEPESSKEQIWQ